MTGETAKNQSRMGTKMTVESSLFIDVRLLKRDGWLRPGTYGALQWTLNEKPVGAISFKAEKDRLILSYHRYVEGSREDAVEVVNLSWTPCNFGGQRVWFRCPRCGRRAAILYATLKHFACRTCAGLTHDSKQEKRIDRLIRKSRKIRKRLGGDSAVLDPILTKPPGMHWKTFWRLSEEVDDLRLQIFGEMPTV